MRQGGVRDCIAAHNVNLSANRMCSDLGATEQEDGGSFSRGMPITLLALVH